MKLTKDIRKTLCYDLMQHRFKTDYLVIVGKSKDFSTKVYNDIFSETEQKTMKSLPKGWMPVASGISVSFGSTKVNLSFNGSIKDWYSRYTHPNQYHPSIKTDDIDRIVPYKFSYGGAYAKVYDARHEFSAEYEDLYNSVVDFHEKTTVARSKIAASLESVTTDTKLLEAWPEIKPFLAKIEKVIIPLPAIPVADLNAVLRLP